MLNVNLSGARFGPRAIRAASARQTSFRGFNPRRGLNPYTSPYTILDCGDIPITPFDNALALQQMTSAYVFPDFIFPLSNLILSPETRFRKNYTSRYLP